MASIGLQRLRAVVQRIMLTVGLGFAAAMVGAVFVAPLMAQLHERAGPSPGTALVVLEWVLSRLWVLAVVPVVAYGAARLTSLSRGSAVGLVAVGEGIYLSIDLLTSGSAELLARPGLLAARLATDLVGGCLAYFAIRSVQRPRQVSPTKGAERNAEYQAFLDEAQRIGSRTTKSEGPRDSLD